MDEMGEKNPLVGILGTALIVSISVNTMMGVYIAKLNKEIKEMKTETVVASEEASSEPAQKDIKFAQFDTSFYKVEDCAVEQVECATIAEKLDYEFDIDADSSMDKLTIEIDKKGNKGVIFKVNGIEYANGKDMKGAKFFLADLNKFDNTIEAIIYDEGENNNPHYMIYSKTGSRMKLLQDVEGPELFLDEIGKVAAIPNDVPKTSPMVFGEYYEYDNGKMSTEKLVATRVRTVEFSAEGEVFVTELTKNKKSKNKNTNTNMNTNSKEENKNTNNSKTDNTNSGEENKGSSEGVALTADDKFTIKSFTDDLDIEVEMKDGRKGYIISKNNSEK